MSDDRRPSAEGGSALTPEFAATEVASGDGDRARTGPRVAERHAAPGARVVGRFRIDAHLGAGGMGDVFRAYDTVLDRAVALKVLRADAAADDGQRIRRVVREARAAAALVHPNAVTVFDVGDAGGEVFIAMELLEGEDLRSVLERGGATLKERLRWLLEAARALSAAHERGLVHRDVKPENMFVCKGGTLKLLDFGIAKRDDDEAPPRDDAAAPFSVGPSSMRTVEGRRIGTPRYMAPEQHAGESTDARTDEYAWGLVAFELLTGTHLTTDLRTRDSDDDGAALASGAEPTSERLDALRASVPELPDALAQTIARALEPRKEERFSSMAPIVAALEGALERFSSPQPVASASAATSEPAVTARTERPRRRPYALLAGVAIGVVALAATAAVVSRAREKAPLSPVAPAGACHVESTRSFAVADDDRLTVLPNGAVYLARNIRGGVHVERDVPDGGTVPTLRSPMFAALEANYEDVSLRGMTLDGEPALLTEVFQGVRGSAFILVTEKNVMTTRRVFGHVTDFDATPFGKDVVVVVASRGPVVGPAIVDGVHAYVLGARAPQPTLIEQGSTGAPAVATNGDRIAVAYGFEGSLHFAFLDANLLRLGDAMKVASTDPAPAIAFAGDTAVVFWVDDAGGKTRLTSSSFTPGAAGFTAPKVATDEPLSPRRPATARLPDGSWSVGWVASSGGTTTVRVARVGAAGSIVGPTEIARASNVAGLHATSVTDGAMYWWMENDKTVRVARVTCAQGAAR